MVESVGERALKNIRKIIEAYRNGLLRENEDIESIFNIYWKNIDLIENGRKLVEDLNCANNELLDIVCKRGKWKE